MVVNLIQHKLLKGVQDLEQLSGRQQMDLSSPQLMEWSQIRCSNVFPGHIKLFWMCGTSWSVVLIVNGVHFKPFCICLVEQGARSNAEAERNRPTGNLPPFLVQYGCNVFFLLVTFLASLYLRTLLDSVLVLLAIN